MRSMLSLAAAVVLATPLAAQNQVVEPQSSVAFPVEITGLNGAPQALAGVALRTKFFIKVKIYAFGLYVDPAGARTSLAQWNGKSASQLQDDRGFYTALLHMSFPMTLRLVMIRNVSGDQMSEAFDEVLSSRVRAATAQGMTGGEQALATFRTYFSVDHLTEATELLFTCANGTLMTSVRGEVKPPINSPALCWSLFDVYLGGDPITPAGRRTVVARMPEILAGR